MKIQNNKKIATTITAAILIGFILLTPITILPTINAQEDRRIIHQKGVQLPLQTNKSHRDNLLLGESIASISGGNKTLIDMEYTVSSN
ncbi:MAG: hypothetical protein KGI27_09355 [Thaumarchaeota archaeon]|nr:hypothetical protein [Nitrososphaerota archaeon]